jgi:hypothetical protein
MGVGRPPVSQLCVLCASVVKKSLTPFLTHCCKLLVASKKLNSFAIKQIRTLPAKYPGYGVPDDSAGHPGPRGVAAQATTLDEVKFFDWLYYEGQTLNLNSILKSSLAIVFTNRI